MEALFTLFELQHSTWGYDDRSHISINPDHLPGSDILSGFRVPRLVPLEMNESVDKPQGNMNWDAEEKKF